MISGRSAFFMKNTLNFYGMLGNFLRDTAGQLSAIGHTY